MKGSPPVRFPCLKWVISDVLGARSHFCFAPDSRRIAVSQQMTFRAMYGRCPRCKRNLTFLRSVRVQPCMRPVFRVEACPVAMQPLWLLALCDPLIGSQPKARAQVSRGPSRVFPIDGLDRFASTSSSPCSSYAHRRKLTLLSPSPLRRYRKRRRPIAAAPGQQCPSNARHLVGNRHRHDPERLAFKKSCDPRILLRLVARPLQHRMGSDHQNASQILVASFRDRPELMFAASRNLPAVRSRSRLRSHAPIEKPSGRGQWRRWRSHPQCQSQGCS